MSFRSTIIAAVVLAGLGFYIYKYESEPAKPETDSEREKVFALDSDALREIEIRRAGGESVKLEKTEDTWQIVAPVTAPADGTEVDSLARAIADLERERVVAEGDAIRLEEFGLATPEIEVNFKSKDAEKPAGFLIGAETPTGTNRYAKLAGEGKVFVISSYVRSNFDKKAWDLRDKKILTFKADEVERVTLRRPEGELILAKAGEGLWNVAAPGFCRADRYKASSLVSRFETAKMEELVSETADDLDGYGLSKPTYEVELQIQGGKSANLLVGKQEGTRYYARNPDRNFVYLIASSLVDDIKKDAAEYRSKRLFEYATYQVDRFQIGPAGQPNRTFEKKKEGKEGEEQQEKWLQTGPESRELDRAKVEDLLYKMNGTDAEDFAADVPQDLTPYGLVAPAFTITVWSKEGETVEELSVGKPEGEWVYARRKGDQPILKLKTSVWAEIENLMSFEEKKEEAAGEGEEKKQPKGR